MGVFNLLGFIVRHPIGRRDIRGALGRVLRWQIASRVSPGAIAVPFIGTARLLVERGMAGATGNVYVGLHEFADMAFTLHFLRSDDLFMDVGANIGSYTILAAECVRASAIAVEPIPLTVRHLRDNIAINLVSDRVTVVDAAVGEENSTVFMTAHLDTMNKVVAGGEQRPNGALEVPLKRLDSIAGSRCPSLMKMDVEGHELAALRGASGLLANAELCACIVEILPSTPNGSEVVELLAKSGFTPMAYDPWERTLRRLSGPAADGNTIFVRDYDRVLSRVKAAPTFLAGGVAL